MIDEERLLEELRNPLTSRKAFARLVSEYSERIYWQIRKMVLSHDDANDILQDVFIKAWSNLENFRGEAKLTTWLYRIAINESITFLNKKEIRTMFPSMTTIPSCSTPWRAMCISMATRHRPSCKKPYSPYPTSNALFFR